jgi:hypothetical protein
MRFVSSYIPPSLFMILGIVFFRSRPPHCSFLILWTGVIAIGFVWRKWSILMACSVIAFQLGIFLRTQEEQKLKTQQEHIKPYLNMPFQIRGEVISHPIPSKNSFSYVLLVNQIYFQDNWKNENFRIQIRTKSYQSPEKKDVIEIKTKLFVPTTVFEIQRIKGIQAYGTVYGDHQWKVLETANAYSTQIRSRIFDVAKLNLSPVSYGYYRAMVFGDQAFLGGAPMERLKETGLLHLFVISGSHIAYVWLIGFWFFRILLSGFGVFHRNKRFFFVD